MNGPPGGRDFRFFAAENNTRRGGTPTRHVYVSAADPDTTTPLGTVVPGAAVGHVARDHTGRLLYGTQAETTRWAAELNATPLEELHPDNLTPGEVHAQLAALSLRNRRSRTRAEDERFDLLCGVANSRGFNSAAPYCTAADKDRRSATLDADLTAAQVEGRADAVAAEDKRQRRRADTWAAEDLTVLSGPALKRSAAATAVALADVDRRIASAPSSADGAASLETLRYLREAALRKSAAVDAEYERRAVQRRAPRTTGETRL